MNCSTIVVPSPNGPIRAIVCGTRPKPKRCAFCGDASEALCDWPAARWSPVPVETLKVGDVWITQTAQKRGIVVGIVDLREHPDSPAGEAFQFWIQIPGHQDPYPYRRVRGDQAVTEVWGTCDKPVCFRHRREVGEDRDYCLEHWNAWEGAHP